MSTRGVLVCSADAALLDLLTRNLARRGFGVRQAAWGPCHEEAGALPEPVHLVVADLDCPEPACWLGVTRLRERFRSVPVVFLAHDRPDAARLRAWRPYRYLPKPFGVGELLGLMQELLPAAA